MKPTEGLEAHPFVRGMRPEHLQLLASVAMPVSFQAGEVIFRQGDPANRFYLLRGGRVALVEESEGGKEREVARIGAGEVLGWSWLFPPYTWNFTARAVEPVEAIFLYGTRLLEWSEADHDLGYELLKRASRVVIERLQETRRAWRRLSNPNGSQPKG